VLNGVDLEVSPGSVVALLGPNGAGKSTLFSVIMGLLPADAGSVRVAGAEVLGQPVHRRAAAGLGYLPQETSAFAELTVGEDLLAIAELIVGRRQAPQRCQELLQRVGLAGLADRRCGVLSGGERRRLEIAKSIVHQPRILLLDEPFSALDPRIVIELGTLIRSFAAEGMAVLLTDHHVGLTLPFADSACLLHAGRIAVRATPEVFSADPLVRASYLGAMP